MGYLKIIQSGEVTEVYEYEREPEYHAPDPSKRQKRGVRRDDRQIIARRADNIIRLQRAFTRLVRANCGSANPPALVTLTMFEVVGIDDAYPALSVFIQHLRAVTKRDIRYIGVPEFQTRGAVHFHLLIWDLPIEFYDTPMGGRTTEADLRESVSRRVQNLWAYGFVDCIETDGSPKLAGYLAKYMRKAMLDYRLLGKRAYSSSHNVLRPVSTAFTAEFEDVSDYYLRGVDNVPLTDRKYSTYWLGEGRYRLYKNK